MLSLAFRLFLENSDLKELILKQDIIFVGGGNTKSMCCLERLGLRLLLKEAYEKGVIMSGVSAGAICWFDKGITDSWAEDLKVMDCFGFL